MMAFAFNKKIFTKVLLHLVVNIFFIELLGQQRDLIFENITSRQGLADINITAIIQDKEGFIWIGSEDGLTKYDGYNCKIYRHQNNNPYSVSDNEIHALCIDNDGTLWVGTRNGLSRYDAQYDRFENFFHEANNTNSISSNEIFALANDTKGNLWIGSYGGGLDIMKKTKPPNKPVYSFIHYKHSETDTNSLSNNRIYSICINAKGDALIGTEKGLTLITENGIVRFFNLPKDNTTIASNTVYRISCGIDGSFWLTGKGMLDRVTISNVNNKPHLIAEHFLPKIADEKKLDEWAISDFIVDNNGYAWVGTIDKGLIRFKMNGSAPVVAFDQFTKSGKLNELINFDIRKFYTDRSGVLWIGTRKGVAKYVPSKNKFSSFRLTRNMFQQDQHLIILSLLCDSYKRLWVGIDSDTLSIINTESTDEPIVQIKLTDRILPGLDQVNTLYRSKAEDIYAGTLFNGFFIIPHKADNIPPKTEWLHISTEQFKELPNNNIYSFTEDVNGLIWIGTYMGLCNYNLQTKTITPVYVSPNKSVVSGYIIRTLCSDEQNNIWCGTDDGLHLVKNGKLAKTFRNNEKDSSSLSNNRITTLFIDHNRNLWIGTKEGLNLFDAATKKFKRYTTQNGLPNNVIESIIEDAKGNLWIGTNNGLVKFNVKTNAANIYTTEEGLASDKFEDNTVTSDANGFLYFGTNSGLVSFHPDSIQKNLFVPPVVITGVKILDQPLTALADTALINTYLREKKLVLRYDQNFFSFEFAALNYINSAANQYSYILEGVDKQWHNRGTQRFANYTDIKPGSYTFKVKGSNNDGIWNEAPITIEVIIIPPWWQTWWFYALCFIAACALVYFIYRIRIKQILKLYNLRSSIAKDLHDDVGSALSSIAMLSNIAQEGKTNAKLQPEEIFSRIGDTSKRMIDLMDDIVWSVNPDNDRFSNMLIRMREYAAEMLEAKNIEYSFKVSDEVDEQKIPMQMRKDYFLIFKESINNLAKYAACTEASISIQKIKNQIVTVIADNGKGFDAQLLNSGNGLKNMQQRAAAIKGTVEINTAINKGTTVTLVIPA